jgi:sensor histidine kinase YesM
MRGVLQFFVVNLFLLVAFVSMLYILSADKNLSWTWVKNNPRELSKYLAYVLIAGYAYLNYYVLVPKYVLANKRFIFRVLTLLIIASIIIFAENFPWHWFIGHRASAEVVAPEAPGGWTGNKPIWVLDYGRTVLVFTNIFLFTSLMRYNRYKTEVENEKLNADLRFLRAQINPHFLFNTLNSIYSLTLNEKAKSSAKAVLQLSGMMRYVASDSHQHFVKLERELAYIQTYLDLQYLRFGESLVVNCSKDGLDMNAPIAPMILVTFLENAFKHGVNPEVKSQIDISIQQNGRNFNFHIHNQKVRLKDGPREGGGIGLSNTRTRLELVYPHKHKLDITETSHDFTVKLWIDLS